MQHRPENASVFFAFQTPITSDARSLMRIGLIEPLNFPPLDVKQALRYSGQAKWSAHPHFTAPGQRKNPEAIFTSNRIVAPVR